jgi:hypothetical protein
MEGSFDNLREPTVILGDAALPSREANGDYDRREAFEVSRYSKNGTQTGHRQDTSLSYAKSTTHDTISSNAYASV